MTKKLNGGFTRSKKPPRKKENLLERMITKEGMVLNSFKMSQNKYGKRKSDLAKCKD